jgi:hypothetical protein
LFVIIRVRFEIMNKYLESFVPTQDLVERKKRRKIRIRFVLFVLAIFIAVNIFPLVFVALRNGTDISLIPLPEYNDLFIEGIQSQLTHAHIYRSKIREPESNFILSNNFHLTVKKIKLSADKPLNEILILQNKQSEYSYQVFGSYADDEFLHLRGGTEKIDTVSKVNFWYRGNFIKISENDSLHCYYLKFKNFSISYDGNSDYDLWGEAKSADDAAISLAFLKKKKSLYIIMLFRTENEKQDFKPDMLYSFIKK